LDGPAAKSGVASDRTLLDPGFRFVPKVDGGTHLATIFPVIVLVNQFQVSKLQLTVIIKKK
jgi:hypothetical protein